MSDTTNEKVQQGECNSLTLSDINDDIIDVSAIDFSDHDTWLQSPSPDTAESSISDLGSWLKSNAKKDCNYSHDNRKSIDTRTFTRPKKRSGRLSFESIGEPKVSPLQNVWNHMSANTMREGDESAESARQDRDSIPHMLRLSIPGSSGVSSNSNSLTRGHESLEAFLNMSRSKGIDSFIDLAEPEFYDDIMDVSQPSVLYSSVLSITTDDFSQTNKDSLALNQSQGLENLGIEDSQILTESMMETSMFGDVVDVNFNDTLGKNSGDVTVLENRINCESMDATFPATPGGESKGTINGTFNTATFNRGKFRSMDATYTPSRMDVTLTNDPHASYIVERSPCESNVRSSAVNDTSYIVTPEVINKMSYVPKIDIAKDASFIVTSTNLDVPEVSPFKPDTSNLGEQNDTFNVETFDATFAKTPISSTKKSSNLPMTNEFPTNEQFEATEKVNVEDKRRDDESTNPSEKLENSTFCKPIQKSQSKLNFPRPSSKLLSASHIFQVRKTNVQNFDATFEKAPPTSEKKSTKIVEESSQVSVVDKVEMKNAISRDKSVENVGNMFCKQGTKMHSKLNVPRPLSRFVNAPNIIDQKDTLKVENFDATFDKTLVSSPKKSSINSSSDQPTNERAIDETFRAPATKINQANIDAINRGGSLDNLDTTFNKPVGKVNSQSNPPRPLSRLPQAFQKSNPNLGSSTLKYASTTTRSAIPSFGFNRQAARPSMLRNVESLQFTSKVLVLGKMKSGSEQRLDTTRNVSELQRTGSGGSTESIDSTQSAHSAPDLDDRLSVRSDGSNTSYGVRTMNIEEFQKIVRMREECLKQESTPKPGRRVLENNWVTSSNDLPSPIAKNGVETYGSRGSSPRSTDSTVKTSSPLLSPTESLQNLPIDGIEANKDNFRENKLSIPRNTSVAPKKISQASIKPPRNGGEPRTGLRPPASWTSANKPASGIPRPASRIPGPRFSRPNTKTTQGDTKK